MKRHLLQSLLQSLLVGLFVFLAFLLVYRFGNKLAAASLAASSFIAFGFPNAESARTRIFLGGYGCALLCGLACNRILHGLFAEPLAGDLLPCISLCALAVFLTAFLMFTLRFQHPPAAAMAISMVIESHPLLMGGMVFLCVLLLCALRTLLKKWFESRFR